MRAGIFGLALPRAAALGGLVAMGFAQGAFADPVQSIRLHVTDGAVLRQNAEAGATETTPFAVASVGKMMTAVAVLRAVAAGRLELDEPVAPLVPRRVASGLDGLDRITVRQLLTMRSGLVDYYDDAFLVDPADAAEDALAEVYGTGLQFAPGRRFDYSNTNYVLLGLILETVWDVPFAEILTREVLVPSGMTDSFVFGTKALPPEFPFGHEAGSHIRDYYTGTGFGDGAVVATAQDLVRFMQALLYAESLLPHALRTDMLHPVGSSGYGMGIEVDGEIVGHSGGDVGFVSDLRANLSSGEIALVLAASSDARTDWTWRVLGQ